MKTPEDKTVVFSLFSHPMKDLKLRWKARLTFPAGADGDSLAELEITDGEERPIKAGVFEFAGARIKVTEGEGRLRCADFVRGKHESAIWLHRRGKVSIPGALTFA